MQLLVTQLRNQDPQLADGHQPDDLADHPAGHDGEAHQHGHHRAGGLRPADAAGRGRPRRPAGQLPRHRTGTRRPASPRPSRTRAPCPIVSIGDQKLALDAILGVVTPTGTGSGRPRPSPPDSVRLPSIQRFSSRKDPPMLRSLYSGISGLRSHQTMLDVTGNNIANVNTTAFKSSAVQFQDTLSQLVRGAGGAQTGTGGTNPAQIGLGVLVAGISTNFTQGSAQATGTLHRHDDQRRRILRHARSAARPSTRAPGRSTSTRSAAWSAPTARSCRAGTPSNGVVQQGGALGDITHPAEGGHPGRGVDHRATSPATCPSDAANGDQLVRDVNVYDANGTARKLTLTFTKTAAGWDVAGADAAGATGTGTLTFTNGVLTGGGSLTVGGVTVDLASATGFAGITTVAFKDQNGRAGRHPGVVHPRQGRHHHRPRSRTATSRRSAASPWPPSSTRAASRRPAARPTARRSTPAPPSSAARARTASAARRAARSRCRTSTCRRSSPT